MDGIGCSTEDRRPARRLDAVDQCTKELMRPGQECDPYGVEERSYGQASGVFKSFHFAEAIAEMPDEKATEISELFAKAERTQLNADFAAAGVLLNLYVKRYWKEQATAVAERTTR